MIPNSLVVFIDVKLQSPFSSTSIVTGFTFVFFIYMFTILMCNYLFITVALVITLIAMNNFTIVLLNVNRETT